jgi:hypothetical protein
MVTYIIEGGISSNVHSHIANTSNPHSVTAADVGAATTSTKLDDFATPDDNTDLNATTGRHGLLPKLGGGTTNYLRSDGTWAEPAGGGTGFTPVVYPDNEEISTDGSNNIYFSGQGTTYVYSGLNTIIISSQVGSAGNLSDLTINANKDWNSKGIYNLSYISSSKISGGTIIGGNFYGTPTISSQISGTQLISRLYTSKPTAANHAGEIIRTSGNANGTWVWISVYNGSSYEWIQIGVST